MPDLDPPRQETTDAPLVFVSYRSKDPDLSLAHQFSAELRKAGIETFMAAESLRIGDQWPQHIDEALDRCSHFLLLLSGQSAKSEMVIEEVQRAKSLHESREDKRPRIMPVRVNIPLEQPLNYDLRGYLHGFHQLLWQSETDTTPILNKILETIANRNLKDSEPQNGEPCDPEPLPSTIGGAPLPVAEPEWPEGSMPADSKFYVERPFIDEECFRHIRKPAALIRILAPRQMGKTSLLARILNHASEQGYATGQISFQLASETTFADLESFLIYFCRRVGRCMGLPSKLHELWDKEFDVVENCLTYFTDYLLPSLERPFVLGLDETDRLFQFPKVAENFLGMLRGFMDGRANDDLWGKFRVVLVHSTECYVTLSVDSSPFNIGRGFRLPPFSRQQVSTLATQHRIPFDDEALEFFELVNGHPFLSRLALYLVANGQRSFRALMDHAHTEAGDFSDHLRRHYWNLAQHADLLAAAKTVVHAQAIAGRAEPGAKARVSLDSVAGFRLAGLGLITPVDNRYAISCEMYQRYFQDRFGITK